MSQSSNYAQQMQQIVARAEGFLAAAIHHQHGAVQPAVVFNIDDTRAHIASLGYSILADFGDQYSDLLGGNAGHQVKIPNPMYYIP